MKNGTGVETFSGANDFAGATTINSGVLQLAATGSLGANTTVTVGGTTAAATGTPTLAGAGTAAGPVIVSSAALRRVRRDICAGSEHSRELRRDRHPDHRPVDFAERRNLDYDFGALAQAATRGFPIWWRSTAR